MLNEAQRAELIRGIYRASQMTGAQPKDLAAIIGYETAGTFDPWKAGPLTKWGQHRGLIQWGQPQAQQYGVSAATPVGVQMDAVARYLQDRGFQPGMGLADLYSTVNAGRPGLYSASDRPGATVASHTQNIASQFGNALDQLQGGQTPRAAAGLTTGSTGLAALFAPQAVAGASALAQSTYDPAFAALDETPTPTSPMQGPDPREARRRALLENIGQLFG